MREEPGFKCLACKETNNEKSWHYIKEPFYHKKGVFVMSDLKERLTYYCTKYAILKNEILSRYMKVMNIFQIHVTLKVSMSNIGT